MKKQLIKEITDINKLIKNEQKIKSELILKITPLEQEINLIEEKFKLEINDKNIYENIPKITKIKKLYETSIRKNRERIFIQYNLNNYKKENETKEKNLQKKLHMLIEKENKNDNLIEKKLDELSNENIKAQRYFSEDQKQEKYIIPPEAMSLNMISKINAEINFMNSIKEETKKIKLKNEQILNELDKNLITLNTLKKKKSEREREKRDSSYNELSTAAKNSSNYDKRNYFFQQQQMETSNNKNMSSNKNNNKYNNNNNINEISSSMSLELETDLNLDNLPSNVESFRFIDKVYDIKSNIKPIKNNFIEKKCYPPSASIPKEMTKKVQPIKVKRPTDYNIKNNQINIDIINIKKEINEKKKLINDIKIKRKNIEEENILKEENLKHACTKVKIIKEQIEVIKKQIAQFKNKSKKNKENDNKYVSFSIYNIINNRNFYLCNINNDDNIANVDTLGK